MTRGSLWLPLAFCAGIGQNKSCTKTQLTIIGATMATKLTERQQQVLDLIRSEVDRTGFPPTRAEIARALWFKSANASDDHLKALARKGARELTARASAGIPLLVAASTPLPMRHHPG